jgi:hypothetical protein
MEAFGGEMAKKCSADLKSGNALANQALTGQSRRRRLSSPTFPFPSPI